LQHGVFIHALVFIDYHTGE